MRYAAAFLVATLVLVGCSSTANNAKQSATVAQGTPVAAAATASPSPTPAPTPVPPTPSPSPAPTASPTPTPVPYAVAIVDCANKIEPPLRGEGDIETGVVSTAEQILRDDRGNATAIRPLVDAAAQVLAFDGKMQAFSCDVQASEYLRLAKASSQARVQATADGARAATLGGQSAALFAKWTQNKSDLTLNQSTALLAESTALTRSSTTHNREADLTSQQLTAILKGLLPAR